MGDPQWKIVAEDDATIIKEAVVRMAELDSMYNEYKAKAMANMEKLQTVVQSMGASTTPQSLRRRGRSIKLGNSLIFKQCDILVEVYDMDATLLKALSTGSDEKARQAFQEKGVVPKSFNSRLASCHKDVKNFINSDYLSCEGCAKLCRKQFCKFVGIKIELVDENGDQTDLDFVCNTCYPSYIQGLQDSQEALTTILATTVGPSTPEPRTVVDSESSNRKKKKSKKKKNKKHHGAFQTPHAKAPVSPSYDGEAKSFSPVTVLDFPDSCFNVYRDPNETKNKERYPSNDRLVNTLAKNGSILVLNEYLNEVEGDEYEDLAPIVLEKAMLQEYRDECLYAARSHELTGKSKAVATKGYLIASQMVAEIEREEATESA